MPDLMAAAHLDEKRVMNARCVAFAVFAFTALLPASALAAERLPDLDQSQPGALEVRVDDTGAVPRFHLGFHSSVNNIGAGPLIIDAHRASTDEPEMVADQTIGNRTVEGVGRLRYVYSADHNHWHYLGFDRYELRRASDYAFVAPDQKTGFCLGDRYDTYPDRRLPGEPSEAFFTGQCGRTETGLLTLREGISVGFGDIYFANLEGQFVDLTGVAAGQYYLVHRVNADRHLVESDYSNNAASMLLAVSWPDGTSSAPSVKVLRACSEWDTCPGPDQAPPPLGRAAAERYARAALGLGLPARCARRIGVDSRRCTFDGVRKKKRWAGRITISLERSRQGILYYRYSAAGTVSNRRCRAVCLYDEWSSSGRVRIGPAPGVSASAAVAQLGQRFVALDDPLLDGVRVGSVVDEVPRLVGDPLGGLRPGLPAQ